MPENEKRRRVRSQQILKSQLCGKRKQELELLLSVVGWNMEAEEKEEEERGKRRRRRVKALSNPSEEKERKEKKEERKGPSCLLQLHPFTIVPEKMRLEGINFWLSLL